MNVPMFVNVHKDLKQTHEIEHHVDSEKSRPEGWSRRAQPMRSILHDSILKRLSRNQQILVIACKHR